MCRITISATTTETGDPSRFSACCSSLVKLLSRMDAYCTVEAILRLMLSLAYSQHLNNGYNSNVKSTTFFGKIIYGSKKRNR